MSCFLESEKPRQAVFKKTSVYFSEDARADGLYRGRLRPFCLPGKYAEENLFPAIRRTALAHFAHNQIKWHQPQGGKPSNHLCGSQVCCVNFLFPFVDKPDALATLLQPIFPNLKRMLPIECGRYVTFEWIGQQNYLGEKISRNGKRTRGALYTSADAIVRFERTDGKQQIVLIEWKYTESYGGASLVIAKSGTDRTGIYKPLYQQSNCPIDKSRLDDFSALFHEPFYQLMRQQFLAYEMEKAHEMGADRVTVLHIAPAANCCFQQVKSAPLKHLGDTVTGIWSALVPEPGSFISISTEKLFGPLWVSQPLELAEWLAYTGARYAWVRIGDEAAEKSLKHAGIEAL